MCVLGDKLGSIEAHSFFYLLKPSILVTNPVPPSPTVDRQTFRAKVCGGNEVRIVIHFMIYLYCKHLVDCPRLQGLQYPGYPLDA